LCAWAGGGAAPAAANAGEEQTSGGKARSISHWFPYDPVGVVNADP
jgi:hypothetical protein